MANIEQNRKLMVEQIKRLKLELNENITISNSDISKIEKQLEKILGKSVFGDKDYDTGNYMFYADGSSTSLFIGKVDSDFTYSIENLNVIASGEAKSLKDAIKGAMDLAKKHKRKLLESTENSKYKLDTPEWRNQFFPSTFGKQIQSVINRTLGVKNVVATGPIHGGRVVNRAQWYYYIPHPTMGSAQAKMLYNNVITVQKNYHGTSFDYHIIVTEQNTVVDEVDYLKSDKDLLKAISAVAKKHKKLLTYDTPKYQHLRRSSFE